MDSGIGGLTTLARLMEVCGGDYVFARDEQGPYGDKSDDFVMRRTIKACAALKRHGAEIIVLACNTATNVAIAKLRECDKGFNYIGIEPAVKPALAACKKIAVALTPTAARQSKFKALTGESDAIKTITLAHLAPAIEKFYFDKRRLFSLAEELYGHCEDCDGLVLGCTHYIFLRDCLSEIDGSLKIFDGNDGVARRLSRFTGYMGAPSVKFITVSK